MKSGFVRWKGLSLGAVMLLAGTTAGYAGSVDVRIMDAKGAVVGDAVVTLTPVGAAQAAPQPVKDKVINQKKTAFDPVVSVVPVGSDVRFVNSDGFGHHVYSFSKPKRFQATVGAGESTDPVTFDKPGVVVLGCNIHDQMLAYLYVTENLLFGQTDTSGSAVFDGVEAGEYEVRAWLPLIRPSNKPKIMNVTFTADAGQKLDITLNLRKPRKKKKKTY